MVIEKNVPMPKARNKYPWGDMKRKDSFPMPKGMTLSSFSGIVSNQAKRDGREYRVGKDENGVVRCWRVK